MEQAGVEEQVGLDVDQHGHTLARVMAAHNHSVDAAECSTLLGLHGSSSSSSSGGGAASFNILVAADKCGPRGSTALAMVSAAGHRDEVEALLDVKCDPNLECCAFDDKYMTEEKLVSSPSFLPFATFYGCARETPGCINTYKGAAITAVLQSRLRLLKGAFVTQRERIA